MIFTWPTDALERIAFEPGAQVEVQSQREVGVVTRVSDNTGVAVYEVGLPGGVSTTVVEAGIRPAVITDPISVLRARRFDPARSCNLRLSGTQLLFAHQFDELSSLSNSRVEIKAHQVAVVHRVAGSYPHRFLLADEVGLGKTIEAGLVIKELKARGVASRVLVLAPSGIVSQWQFELKTKFNEIFSHYNRASIAYLTATHPRENVWTLNDNVITSSTFASWDEGRRREIALAGWDLVVIDEAHHARRQWQGESKYTETNLYRLAEMLADPEVGRSVGFLLLTATPMQLHPFELYSLIELLDPALFPSFDDFESHREELAGLNYTVEGVRRWEEFDPDERQEIQESVREWLSDSSNERIEASSGRTEIIDQLLAKHRLSDVLIRNRKAVIGGFQPRVAAVWPVSMTQQEWDAYEAVTEYVRSGYAKSKVTRNNALGFLMVIFQKLNSSSSFALRQSLSRRIEKLQRELPPNRPELPEDDDLEEGISTDVLANLLGVGVQHAEEVQEEVAELQRIVGLLDRIELDTKARVFLDRLDEFAESGPSAKVVVFTQFRDTQSYLAERIPGHWDVNLFHGQLKPEEKDSSIARFRESTRQSLLLTTEAGGEGRNLQFCHNLINYDLPWNPMKIEQRIGRLDRIGQKYPVTIINFSVKGTVEDRVLEVLTNRIRVFEETIGGLDPILGSVEEDLKKILLMADAEAERALRTLDRQLESRVRQAQEAEKRLADFIMDTKSFRQDEVRRLLEKKGKLDSSVLKRFVLGSLNELGVFIQADTEMEGIYDLRLQGRFLEEFPHLARDQVKRRVTFDPAVALDFETIEFLAFGHELVDALIERVVARKYPGRASVRRIRSDDQLPTTGWFFTFVLEFDAVQPTKEILPVFIDAGGEPEASLASWLFERAGLVKFEEWEGHEPEWESADLDNASAKATNVAVQAMLKKQGDLASSNRLRLDQERPKLERLYEYRTTAAADKLAAVQTTFERISTSDDPDVQRIIPVWAKNLETAKRNVQLVEADRTRRLAELVGKDQVTAQHHMLTASYVVIEPKLEKALTSTE
ncbi:MAG: helicase-related protein [Dehalococcoidia bacterium]